MKRSLHLSAAQLAAFSLLGGLIGSSAFFLLISPLVGGGQHPSDLWWAFVIAACLMLAGFSIAYLAASNLESGIATERWPENEINDVRARLLSPLTTALALALFAAYLVLAFFNHRYRIVWFPPFILLQTLTFLRSSVRLRSTPPHESKWGQLSPIRSEHWGQH
jgi:MFS family permease